MDTKEIFLELVRAFPEVGIELTETGSEILPNVKRGGIPFITVPRESLARVLETLRLLDAFSFDCLMNLTAVDYSDRIEIVYHLFSYRRLHTVQVKSLIAKGGPLELGSVEHLWKSANWLEREVYDLFGVNFAGHPDLRRIMLPDDWEGHPLRKDYVEPDVYQWMETRRAPLI